MASVIYNKDQPIDNIYRSRWLVIFFFYLLGFLTAESCDLFYWRKESIILYDDQCSCMNKNKLNIIAIVTTSGKDFPKSIDNTRRWFSRREISPFHYTYYVCPRRLGHFWFKRYG